MQRIKLSILVEGQTEAVFVRDIIAPHLREKEIDTWYSIIPTAVRERTYRGGISSFETQTKPVLLHLLQGGKRYVTTMFDFYGLPKDFPGKVTLNSAGAPQQKVAHLEDAFRTAIASRWFIPYLQLHEFEALLYSDIQVLDLFMQLQGSSKIAELSRILLEFKEPESIDDDPATAPSKRLLALYPTFQKTFHGNQIAAKIPLGTIREKCPHFNHWLCSLEQLTPDGIVP